MPAPAEAGSLLLPPTTSGAPPRRRFHRQFFGADFGSANRTFKDLGQIFRGLWRAPFDRAVLLHRRKYSARLPGRHATEKERFAVQFSGKKSAVGVVKGFFHFLIFLAPSAAKRARRGRWRCQRTFMTHVALREDVEMRTYDFSPFYRSSVGYDRMLDRLGAPSQGEPNQDGPAYNIERLGEDRYCITMAVAGFGEDDLSIMTEHNTLLVEGQKRNEEGERNFLHRGIVERPFRRLFDLADFVKVTGASYDNGLLSIQLEREIPEAMKPRRIEIGAASQSNERRKRDSGGAENRAERETETVT
jgi:molecular chaperone IbpA